MSDDISPYGTHQHASPHAVRIHTLVGEPTRLATLDGAIDGASRATFSTAPYKKPAGKPGAKGCWAKDGKCGAPAVKGERYCWFHSEHVRDPR